MLTRVIKKNWKENKDTYITVGICLGIGLVVGMKVQKKIDVRNLTKNLKAGKAMIPNMDLPMFPPSMTLAEIKKAVLAMDTGSVKESLVVTIDGLPLLFVR